MNKLISKDKTFIAFPGGVPDKTELDRHTKPIYQFHDKKWVKIIQEDNNSSYKAFLTPIHETIDPIEVFKRLAEKKTRIMSATKPRVPSASETRHLYKSNNLNNPMQKFIKDISTNKSSIQDKDLRLLLKKFEEKINNDHEVYQMKRENTCLELKNNFKCYDLQDPMGYLIQHRQEKSNKRIISAMLQWKISPSELLRDCASRSIYSTSNNSFKRPFTVR